MTDAEISAYWNDLASTREGAAHATGADDPDMTRVCLDLITSHLPDNPAAMLEIGCGVGRLTIPIANLYDEERTTIIGVDSSEKMLEFARSRAKTLCVGDVQFFQATRPDSFLFPESSYRFAWTALTLQHLSPERAREYVVAVGKSLRWGAKFLFQYIEGDEREPFSNHFRYADVEKWCAEGGMKITWLCDGVGHLLWRWILAVKR